MAWFFAGPSFVIASWTVVASSSVEGGVVSRPIILYLGGSAVLVGALYMLCLPSEADPRALAVEALFAWLAVFVPPLLLVERALALARLLLRRARGH
jgi:hypothetical protein